jgi:hypothetical protein
MAKVKSWQVSDSFWPKAEPLIPLPQRDPNQKYQPKAGGGRKPMPARQILEEIVYLLPIGGQWKALSKEGLASSSAIHTHLLRWAESGFLVTLWPVGLAEYDEMEGISWKWSSIDGATVKAALAPETVGQHPTEREKRKPAKFVSRRPWSRLVTVRKRSQSAGCYPTGNSLG